MLANVYLEECVLPRMYPETTQDERGMLQLFRQFSTPGGVPSHVGAAHASVESTRVASFGYVLTMRSVPYSTMRILVAVAVGDGEAETAPLEGSWKGIRLPQRVARRHRAARAPSQRLQITRPTVLGRADDETVDVLLEGHGYAVHFVSGDEPMAVRRTRRDVQ